VDRDILEDVAQVVAVDHYHRMLEGIVRVSRPGARLAYWNMLAPRRVPESMAPALRPLDEFARELHRRDRAFFYSAFRVEEVQC
ncbi:MAG TPA: hypothetical protein VG106_08960, partial [Vicinamibacterales bacterium]|nr:hypothetical protein [Vicinamibacterales bacterium]